MLRAPGDGARASGRWRIRSIVTAGLAFVSALFMREFTGGVPWAHLDIAGTAFAERDLPLGPKGGTGVAVRTLLAYISALGGGR